MGSEKIEDHGESLRWSREKERERGGGKGERKNFETPGIAPFVSWGWPQVERNHESLPHSMEIHKGTTGPFVILRVSTCPSRPWLANNVTLHGGEGKKKKKKISDARDKEEDGSSE